MMPMWKKMKKQHQDDPELNRNIYIKDINSKINTNHELIKLNKLLYPHSTKIAIDGFPTIGRVNNGSYTQYGGGRDVDSLMKWLHGMTK